MNTFLTSETFRYFVVPLVTVLLSVFVKTASRNDQYKGFKKEDLAVGLEIALASLIALITQTASVSGQLLRFDTNTGGTGQPTIYPVADKQIASPWLIASFAIGLWGISTLVRKVGWKNEDELTWWFGIVFPFVYGVLTLLVLLWWIGE